MPCIACRALDVGPGDMVWTTPITFVATSNCALYCGAGGFRGHRSHSYNLSPEKLAEKLDHAENREICQRSSFRCISPVSLVICRQFRFKPEVRLQDHWGCFALHWWSLPRWANWELPLQRHHGFQLSPGKVVTTGEGGMCVTNDTDLLIGWCCTAPMASIARLGRCILA